TASGLAPGPAPTEGCLQGRGDLVEASPDAVHVDLPELGVHPVRKENVDSPAVRVDEERRPREPGVSERTGRQPRTRRPVWIAGHPEPERPIFIQSPGPTRREQRPPLRVQEP